MALRATVYKVELAVSDLDRNVFGSVSLALARHPSETEERLLVRLIAYALHFGDGLQFGRGISSDDEATLWKHGLDGTMHEWIEVGLPDERVLRRAAGRARDVTLYTYGGRAAALWWTQNSDALARLQKLHVLEFEHEFTLAATALMRRNMDVQVTRQDEEIWLSIGDTTLNTRLLTRR
jgi:uncharacterized protein YaeQ